MKLKRLLFSLLLAIPSVSSLCAPVSDRISDVLRRITNIEIPAVGHPVERTVARAMRTLVAPDAVVHEVPEVRTLRPGTLRIAVSTEATGASPGWLRFRLLPDGSGELTTSHAHLLYTAFCRVRDEWLNDQIREFAQGKTITMRLPWMEGSDGMFTGLPRLMRNYDPEKTVQELARLGCSHVSVNLLAFPTAYEQGPPGEIYYRFYAGSPDLDQFVTSDLTEGLYPPEYLRANLNLLQRNAALAIAYGLTPGLTVCSPRTMPEAFFSKYPYLRGARVDHPFRSYRPRYTATLSHPVVRWHYAQLMRAMMKEVPQLGFLYLWTNDSGSGFEYVSTLYAGRNGGAYLIREWKSHDDVARAAGENVLRYLRLLRDAASETNSQFRIITSVSWFGAEQGTILDGLGERMDLHISLADTANAARWSAIRNLNNTGSELFGGARLASNFVLGVPSPWLSHDRLIAATAPGVHRLAVTFDPPSLSPWNINREILQAFQNAGQETVDKTVEKMARRWVAAEETAVLVRSWRLTDQAVRSFPDVPLYGTSWAFPLYRHWVRPFVPNIAAIPDTERAYYEQHMIATFNNPTLIDFGADALWLLVSREQAASIVRTCDSLVWKPLDEAIGLLEAALKRHQAETPTRLVFQDQHDRLLAVRCYFRTLRNIAGWIDGVRGSMAAITPEARNRARSALRATIDNEIQNAEDLLHLWQTSKVDFIPIAQLGENWSLYGDNLGHLIQKKIALMKKHRDDTPFIDPDFMWRMDPECPVPQDVYVRY